MIDQIPAPSGIPELDAFRAGLLHLWAGHLAREAERSEAAGRKVLARALKKCPPIRACLTPELRRALVLDLQRYPAAAALLARADAESLTATIPGFPEAGDQGG